MMDHRIIYDIFQPKINILLKKKIYRSLRGSCLPPLREDCELGSQ